MAVVELLFLGTGTSAGIPMIGCHCEVCTSVDPRDRRTRPSVIVAQDEHRVLVDTTPELRLQCVANEVDRIDAVVYTHAHADHIMGLDDVRRFNAIKKGPLDVWADDATHQSLTQCFGYAFKPPSPDLKVFRPHLERRTIEGSFTIGPMTWTPIPLLHGRQPILGFRVGKLAYCTDVNEIPDASFDLLKGLDVLVLDALQHRPRSTLFSIEQAIVAARRVGARQTYFTHIAHAVSHARDDATLPDGIHLAYDGLRVISGG
jgi:phosphoribosyl 1,2-cyclic phosphate phosphodiesterase